MKSHYSLFTIHHSRYVLVVLFFVLSLFMVNNAQAGIIVKAPAYLGLSRGLVGSWNFDGGNISGTRAKDSSGNENHGIITPFNGSSPEITIGKIGQALDFKDADDNYVVTTNAVTLSSGTISAWIKYRVLNANEDVVVAFNTGGCAGAAGVLGRSPGAGFTGNGFGIFNGTWKIASTGVDPTPGVWYHILGTWGAGGIKFYENGVFKSSDPDTSGFTNQKLTMGVANCPDDLQGAIDDVRVYNRALSAGEISRLYRIGLGSTANRGASASPLDRGLITHWTFDAPDISGTRAKDRSGKNMHGTLTNSPVKKPGIAGQALYYDTSNLGYVTVNHNSAVYGGLASGSFSFWAKIDIFNQVGGIANVTIAKNAGGANNGDVSCGFLSTRKHRCNFDDGATAPNFDTVGTCSAGTWCHITYTWASGLIKVYLNGKFDNSESRSSSITPLNSGQPFSSGFSSGTTNGTMDDVRVYNHALSAGEIARLYNSTQSKFNSSKTDILTNGLILHWTFDGSDISGTRAKDISGSNNHGTLTNSPVKVVGKTGQALEFTSSGQKYIVSSNLVNIPKTTVSAWVKISSYHVSQKKTVVTFLNGLDSSLIDKKISVTSDGKPEFHVYDGTDKLAVGTTTVPLNTWVHLVGTADGTNAKIYMNGVEVGTVAAGNTFISYTVPNIFVSGRNAAATNDFLDGSVDDVRIYNRALSASEVNKLYQMGR